MRELQDARLVGVGFGDLGGLMFGVDLREWRQADEEPEQEERRADPCVRDDDAADELVERGGFLGRPHRREAREEIGVGDLEDHRRKDNRCEDPRTFIADPHHADAARGGLLGTQDGNIGIRRRLEDGEAGAEREQAAEEKAVRPRHRRRDKQEGAHCHDPEANHHPALETGALEEVRRRH